MDEIRGCLRGRTPDDCKVYTSDDLGGTEYSSLQELFYSSVRSHGIQFPETVSGDDLLCGIRFVETLTALTSFLDRLW